MIVLPLTLRQANAFVAQHHRHNRPVIGAKFAIGAAYDLEPMYGVALVGRPIARHLDDGLTLEVLRLCTREGAPKGACSFLYNRCRRAAGALGFRWCVTYTLASEGGASLRGAGWKIAAHLNARPGWDTPCRPRLAGTVDQQEKIRWEVAC